MGTHLSNKYSQKLLNSAKISATDAIRTSSKRAIQKTAEATDDLFGNKVADKITVFQQISTLKRLKTINQKQIVTAWRTYQKKDKYLQKKDKKLLMN